MPVVMVSTLTQQGAEVTLDAMEAGAVDFVSKPKVDVAATLEDYADEIVAKVLAARTARLRGARRAGAQRSGGPLVARVGRAALPGAEDGIIAIGASTGGTEAIKDVLMALPPDMPGVVIAQHIPAGFSEAFANRMHRLCSLEVREARDGDAVLRGHVLIAPGGKHLSVRRDGSRYRCRVDETAPVNRHRPSVDVLFESVAAEAGGQAVGVLLTGMGADGAEGLAQMHRQGAHTIAQDEASSVVWGMPGEAVRLGACSEVLGLTAIPGTLIKLSQRGFAAPKATAAHGRRLPLHEESTP
jgi:two-component system chemotaxis response regulator CheB